MTAPGHDGQDEAGGPVIRPAAPADVGGLIGLIRDLAEYERAPHEVAIDEAMLTDALFRPAPTVFASVVDEGGQLLGMAVWYLTFSTWTGTNGIHLEDLYVRPEARGRGLGRRLLQMLAATAEANGYARVEWSVLTWNEPALGFYRSLGAVPLDQWIGYRLSGDALRRLSRSEPDAGPGT